MDEKQFSLNDLQKVLNRLVEIVEPTVYKTGIVNYRRSYNELGRIDLWEVVRKSKLELALEFCNLDDEQKDDLCEMRTSWIVVDSESNAHVYDNLEHLLAEVDQDDKIYLWDRILWQWRVARVATKAIRVLEVE